MTLKPSGKALARILWRNASAAAEALIRRLIRVAHAMTQDTVAAFRRARAAGHAGWRGLKHWQRHWVGNILIGFAIWLVISVAAGTRLVVGAQNWAMDTTQRVLATLPASYPVQPLPIIVVDVDDETWRNPVWGGGEPYRAPRAELGKLIRYALSHHALYVVVDVIVEDPAGPEDLAFADTVAELSRGLKPRQRILFVRTVREPLVPLDGLASQLRSSPLGKMTAAPGGPLVEVAPYFDVSSDGVLRDWRLWQAACISDPTGSDGKSTGLGRWKILPSVQLAIAALYYGVNAPWEGDGDRKRCLASPDGFGTPGMTDETLEDEEVTEWLRLHPALTKHEIEYQSQLKTSSNKAHKDRGVNPSSRIFFADTAPPKTDRIQVVSALNVLGESHVPQHFDGAVVIIGQSSEAARDIHATPLGAMPGAMVIANALESLFGPGIVQPAPEPFEIVFEILSIVVIGWVFACKDSMVGTLVIAVPFAGFLILTNYLMMRSGYWFDFALPLIGLYAHRLVTSFEEYLELRRHRAGNASTARGESGGEA